MNIYIYIQRSLCLLVSCKLIYYYHKQRFNLPKEADCSKRQDNFLHEICIGPDNKIRQKVKHFCSEYQRGAANHRGKKYNN